MTVDRINQHLKDAYVRNLQKDEDLPTDVANTFSAWVQALIQNAVAQTAPAPQEEAHVSK